MDKTIFQAAAQGDITGVKKQIEVGFEVNKGDEEGYTPLHWAVQEGHKDLVKFSLNKERTLISVMIQAFFLLNWPVLKDTLKL